MGRDRKPLNLERNPSRGRREYRARIYDSNGKLHRSWLRTSDYEIALERLQQFKQSLEKKEEEIRSPSVDRLIEKFLTDREPHLRSNTLRYYSGSLDVFREFLGGEGIKGLIALRNADLRGYGAFLLRKYRPGAANAHIRAAKRLCNYYECHKQVKQLEMVQEPEKEIRLVTPEELTRLLKAASPMHQAMILFLAMTGASRSEMITLTWDQVDLENSVLRLIRGIKRRRPRFVPIHPLLQSMLEQLPRDSEYVFPNERGTMRDPDGFTRRFREIVKRAGVEKCKPHNLRSSFISALVDAGFPAEVAQELAGHADVRITRQYYLRFRADKLRDAIKALPAPKVN